MIASFQENAKWRTDHLPPHEQKVYDSIQIIMNDMVFKDNVRLDNQGAAKIILNSVVIPKIGQRQDLGSSENPQNNMSFQSRNLITNHRALIEFDSIVQEHIDKSKNEFQANKLILKLINAYQNPWHGSFTRTYQAVKPYIQDINDCQNNNDLLNVLNRMEISMGKRNQHGHMQSLVHYAKWILEFSNENKEATVTKFNEYFACQQVRKMVDQEIHHGTNREEKQEAFKELSNQLANVDNDVETYQRVVNDWLNKSANDKQSTQQMLSENRSSFFAKPATHAETTVSDIKKALDRTVIINTMNSP